jgi:hypothetical protein
MKMHEENGEGPADDHKTPSCRGGISQSPINSGLRALAEALGRFVGAELARRETDPPTVDR